MLVSCLFALKKVAPIRKGQLPVISPTVSELSDKEVIVLIYYYSIKLVLVKHVLQSQLLKNLKRK
jgi:hypothetical protein